MNSSDAFSSFLGNTFVASIAANVAINAIMNVNITILFRSVKQNKRVFKVHSLNLF